MHICIQCQSLRAKFKMFGEEGNCSLFGRRSPAKPRPLSRRQIPGKHVFLAQADLVEKLNQQTCRTPLEWGKGVWRRGTPNQATPVQTYNISNNSTCLFMCLFAVMAAPNVNLHRYYFLFLRTAAELAKMKRKVWKRLTVNRSSSKLTAHKESVFL